MKKLFYLFLCVICINVIYTNSSFAYEYNIDELLFDIGIINSESSELERAMAYNGVYNDMVTLLPGGEAFLNGVGSMDQALAEFTGIGRLSGYPEDLLMKEKFTREDVIRVAMSLLDVNSSKPGMQPVPYFWGGGHGGYSTYPERGFDPEWFSLKTVKAPNNDTSGYKRPLGLDCSGFIAWVYTQLPDGQREKASGLFSATAEDQYNRFKHITKSQLKPGDLGFFQGLGHVGMFVGKDPNNGKLIFIHSAGEGERAGPVPGLALKGYIYERGLVRLCYLGEHNDETKYVLDIDGEVLDSRSEPFVLFARVMDFPED